MWNSYIHVSSPSDRSKGLDHFLLVGRVVGRPRLAVGTPTIWPRALDGHRSGVLPWRTRAQVDPFWTEASIRWLGDAPTRSHNRLEALEAKMKPGNTSTEWVRAIIGFVVFCQICREHKQLHTQRRPQ